MVQKCLNTSSGLLLQVICIDQPHHVTPPKMPAENYNYHRKLVSDWRTDLKPWNVIQPQGPSFKVGVDTLLLSQQTKRAEAFQISMLTAFPVSASSVCLQA